MDSTSPRRIWPFSSAMSRSLLSIQSIRWRYSSERALANHSLSFSTFFSVLVNVSAQSILNELLKCLVMFDRFNLRFLPDVSVDTDGGLRIRFHDYTTLEAYCYLRLPLSRSFKIPFL